MTSPRNLKRRTTMLPNGPLPSPLTPDELAGPTTSTETLQEVPIANIRLPAHQVRTVVDPEPLSELADSINRLGLLQPIVVIEKPDGFELVAGYRRLLATKLLGKPTIMAIVRSIPSNEVLLAMLTENIQREDLSPVEEAHAVRRIQEIQPMGLQAIAQLCGKSRAWVEQRIDLLRADEKIVSAVHQGVIGLGAGLELSKISNPQVRDQYLQYAILGGITLSEARRWREQAAIADTAVTSALGLAGEGTSQFEYQPALLRCAMCLDQVRMRDSHTIYLCSGCIRIVKEAQDSGHTQENTTP